MRVGRIHVSLPVEVLAFLAIFTTSLSAQEDQTLITGDIESGYFSAPVLKITPVDGSTRLLIGARGAWVANRNYALGLGGYWMIESVESEEVPGQGLRLAYGGVDLEYIHNTQELLHFSGQLLLGAGKAWLTGDVPDGSSDWIIIAEPQANVELNVTSRFRIAAGLGYRLAAANSLPGVSNGDLGGLAFSLTFKSGSF